MKVFSAIVRYGLIILGFGSGISISPYYTTNGTPGWQFFLFGVGPFVLLMIGIGWVMHNAVKADGEIRRQTVECPICHGSGRIPRGQGKLLSK